MRTEGAIITNVGKDLLSYALANKKEVIFTKAKLGKGDISSLGEAQTLQDVVSFYKEIPLTSISRNKVGIVRIRTTFTNENFSVDVILKEVGIFAKVEGYKEALISYVNDGEGENFPAGSSGNIVEKVRDIYIGISTTTNVLAEIDKSNVYATIYDLEEEIEKCVKKVTKIIPGNGLQGGGTLGENVILGVKSNDTSINIDQENGVTLKKINSWLNDAAQLFTAKGALNLFNTLTTNFTNAINSAKEVLRLEIVKKEDKFEKKSGFNLDKTDVPENDSNKLITAKGALDLKNWIVTAYTNAINTTKSVLENLIGNKLNHGGYSGTGQALKNEIDNKINKTGGTITGNLTISTGYQPTLCFNVKNSLKGGIYGEVDALIMYNEIAQTYFHLKDNGDTTISAKNLKTNSKEIVSAINEIKDKKLENGGFTGTAKNLSDEINKKASGNTLGRVLIGKGLSVDDNGRVSVNVFKREYTSSKEWLKNFIINGGNGAIRLGSTSETGNLNGFLPVNADYGNISVISGNGDTSILLYMPNYYNGEMYVATLAYNNIKNNNPKWYKIWNSFSFNPEEKLDKTGGEMTGSIRLLQSSIRAQLKGFGKIGTNLNESFLTEIAGINYSLVLRSASNLFPTGDNANGLLTFNTHEGSYAHQIGLSSNGGIYHRSIHESNIKPWKKIINEEDLENSKSVMEVLWRGNASYEATLNLNKDLRNYDLLIFDFGGEIGGKYFSNPLIYPVDKNMSTFMIVLTDTWGGTVHEVDATVGRITYTRNYNGGAHAENKFKRIVGIKL